MDHLAAAFDHYTESDSGRADLRGCLRSERMRTVLEYAGVEAVRRLVEAFEGEALYVPARSTLREIGADPGLPPRTEDLDGLRDSYLLSGGTEEEADRIIDGIRGMIDRVRDEQRGDAPTDEVWRRRILDREDVTADLPRLVTELGTEDGREIARTLQSDGIPVPTREAVVRGYRDRQIRQSWTGDNADELADRWGLSSNRIRQIAETRDDGHR